MPGSICRRPVFILDEVFIRSISQHEWMVMGMKKSKLALVLLFLFLCAGSAFGQPKAPSDEFVRGDVLVVLEAPGGASEVESQANKIAEATSSRVIRTYSAIAAATGKNIVQLKAEGKSAEELLAEVRQIPGVLGATPNFIVKILRTPNDPDFSSSWGMEHSNVSEAWEVSTGSEEIYVALLDTGIQYDHEDLAANIGRDKDGNFGRNLVSVPNATNPMDDNGHGTHLAGIIGAAGDNGLGATGINWTVKLLAVKVLDGNGAASIGHIIAGINYVLEQKSRGLNIRVANMAFGGWTPSVNEPGSDPLAIACKALSDAGVLLVAAAGNEGQNIARAGGGYKGNMIYPAAFAFPEMVTVAAITQNGALAKFSNFGASVDIAAPGYEVRSTALGGKYAALSGTSVASAHVAGAAALLVAVSPELTSEQIKTRLLEYATGHQTLSGKVASGGTLNIGAAIKNERGSLKVLIEGPASARWSLNGKGSYPSGQTLTGLPAGNHTISFSDENLWKKPANVAVTVTSGTEAEATGKYRQQNASIWVTIEGPEGAHWSLNKKGEYTSDQILGKVAGKRTVSFSAVPGWDTPAPQSVTVPRNAPLAVSGVYTRQTGSVVVTFEGPAEARWSLDGQGSYASGETVENVPTGNRRVSFSAVKDWDTPQDIVVLVAKGASVAAEGKYIHQVGSIKVTLDGPEEASWTVNGRGLYTSGETASNIPVGEHTIVFSAVQDWDHPVAVPVTVIRDQTVEISVQYAKHLGSVSVSLKGPSDARWGLEGIEELFENGAVRADLPVGEYTVVFKDVANWYAPEKMKVTVVKGEVAQIEASYSEHRGSVVVQVDGPSEARWSLDGVGSYASGEIAKDVVVGKHTVSFSDIADWDKPADGTVEVVKDAEAVFKGTYAQHKGSLQVMIDGPAGALWRLNGKGSYKDGEIIKDLVVGEYSVSFFDLADWDEPAEQTVKVLKNTVAKLDVEFIQHKGSVQVVLFGPEEARWSLDGKGSYASGETVKDVIVGTYTLSFSQVNGWDAPQDFQITVAKDTLAKAEPGYTRHLGSVTVTLDGPAEARWSLDGKGSYESGQTVDKVVVGEHTVSFSEIADWDTPADQTVSVTKDALSTITGSYKQHKGSVKITIKGPEEARWNLNGDGSYASDALVENLVVGEYAVTFSKIDGWDRPREQKLVVGKDATATFEGVYTQHVGAVAVSIEGPTEALWKISGIEKTYAGGEAVKDLPVGEYTVSFSDADGWEKPDDQSVTVFRNVTAMATGVYTRHVGSVSTVIEGPESALWSLNGEGSYASGEVVQKLPSGEYIVSFSDVEGWEKPEDQNIVVAKDGMTSVSAVYTRQKGSVSAVIEGPESALWSLNGEGSYASGEVVQKLPVGEYVVSFSVVEGWEKPEDQNIVVAKDGMTSVSAVYTRQKGSVSAVIEGPESALWSLNGEGSYASGEVLQGLPVGEYVVSFSEVEGWNTPADAAVSVMKDSLASVTGSYAQSAIEEPAVEEPAKTEEPKAEEAAVEEVKEEAAPEEATVAEESKAEAPVVEGVKEEVASEEPVAVEEAPKTEEAAVEEVKEEAVPEETVAAEEPKVEEPAKQPEEAVTEAVTEQSAVAGEAAQEVAAEVVEAVTETVEEVKEVVSEEPVTAEEPAAPEEKEEAVSEEPVATEAPKTEEAAVEEVKEEAVPEETVAAEEPKVEEPKVEEPAKQPEEAVTEAVTEQSAVAGEAAQEVAAEVVEAVTETVEEVKEVVSEEPVTAEEPATPKEKKEAVSEEPVATEAPKTEEAAVEKAAVEEVKEEAVPEETVAAEEPKEEPKVEEPAKQPEEAVTEAVTEQSAVAGEAAQEVAAEVVEAVTETVEEVKEVVSEEPVTAEEPATPKEKEEAVSEEPVATEAPKAEEAAVEEAKKEAAPEETAVAEEPKTEIPAVEEEKDESVSGGPVASEELKPEESSVKEEAESVEETVKSVVEVSGPENAAPKAVPEEKQTEKPAGAAAAPCD